MELAPLYQARRYRQTARDSISLAMDAGGSRSAGILIDTAIESTRAALRLQQDSPGARAEPRR